MNRFIKIVIVCGLTIVSSLPVFSTRVLAQAQSAVGDWNTVAPGQQVSIARAMIDEGGYQLVTADGDTIVVPFDNHNLYVMKFAVSTTGSMYFVNSGSAPVLYLPTTGYLDNVTVAGTRWYPFNAAFQPADPVYLGIAPGWSDFILMGWYAGMNFYGGFTVQTPIADGGTPTATADVYGIIDGQEYQGWPVYRDYCDNHRTYNYVGFYSRGIYERAAEQSSPVAVPVPALPVIATPATTVPVVPTEPNISPVAATAPPVLTTAVLPSNPTAHVFRGCTGYVDSNGVPLSEPGWHNFRGGTVYVPVSP